MVMKNVSRAALLLTDALIIRFNRHAPYVCEPVHERFPTLQLPNRFIYELLEPLLFQAYSACYPFAKRLSEPNFGSKIPPNMMI